MFVQELIDIDWVPAPGSGVSLDIELPEMDERGLIGVLRELSDIGWATGSGRWSIQQATRNWHGTGVNTFADAVVAWQHRYQELPSIHHTEEVTYYDACDGGFYVLAADISASRRRHAWHCDLSFQLIGVPVDAEPFRHLCSTFDIDTTLFFRPRVEKSIESHYIPPEERRSISPVAFVVVTGDSSEPDTPWVEGIVVENPPLPAIGSKAAPQPDWWPAAARESAYLVCDLRSHHPLAEPKTNYSLRSCEWAWAADALLLRPIADW